MLSREEREKLGLVGKKEDIGIDGRKIIVDYDSETEEGCTGSVFTMKEWLSLSKEQARVKERIYSEDGNLVEEILREEEYDPIEKD